MKTGFFGRLSRAGMAAVVVGGLGYAWSIALVFAPANNAIFKPSPQDQQPYPPPGYSNYGDGVTVTARLKGWPPESGQNRTPSCWYGMAIWREDEPLVRGRGESNGSNVAYWVAETIDKRTFLGRYSFDLSYLVEPGTGAIGFSHAAQVGDNTRFIERIPPPPPEPPGWRVIQPGECVLAREEAPDTDGTVGRFFIDLPGKALIHIESELAARLSFNGKEAAREPIPGAEMGGFHYRTEQPGRYSVAIHRPPSTHRDDVEPGEQLRYSLMIVWGETDFRRSCTSPRDDLSCLGEKDDD